VTGLTAPLIIAPRGDLPVLLSVPHSGRDYPEWLVSSARGGLPSLRSLEDPLVDRLVWRALKLGLGAVIARAPRAAIDCNRAEDEIDHALIDGCPPCASSARARSGLGIIPSRTQTAGRLWRTLIRRDDLDRRLEAAHRPYHGAIATALADLVERHGTALLLDCHSMPPPKPGRASVVFGDLHGRSAEGWVGQHAMAIARDLNFQAGLNDPFAGGYIVERHGAPERDVHAIQIELDRLLYLDGRLANPGPGFDRTAGLLERLALGLGEALLGRRYATAAE
jgi:N-formylglutamate amidohydrolase